MGILKAGLYTGAAVGIYTTLRRKHDEKKQQTREAVAPPVYLNQSNQHSWADRYDSVSSAGDAVRDRQSQALVPFQQMVFRAPEYRSRREEKNFDIEDGKTW